MALSDDLLNEVQTIISTPWDKRDGRKIPETEDVALAGGAVEIDATFLYADLADSSKMAKELDRRIAAKIIKSFLYCASNSLLLAEGKSLVLTATASWASSMATQRIHLQQSAHFRQNGL